MSNSAAHASGHPAANRRRGGRAAPSARLGTAVARRAAQAIATLFAASILTFALVPLAPGEPARTILQLQGRNVTEAEVDHLEHKLGLDKPLLEQYGDWVTGVLQGDLSRSYRTQEPVSSLLAERIGPTMLLGGLALVMAFVLAVGTALVSVAWAGRWPDRVVHLFAMAAVAIPGFVLGLLLLQYVVIGLGWGSIVADGSIRTVWMPAFTLAVGIAAVWSRSLRSLMLEALSRQYNLVAEARGASKSRVLIVHALPNALVPFLSLIGLGVGAIIGGAVIVETVFSWPGLGQLVVEAVTLRDLPVIQGFVLVATLTYVVASLTVDALALALDPRLRVRSAVR